jgi:hypothetical protein
MADAEDDFAECGSGCQLDRTPWPHTMVWGNCAHAVRDYQGERPVVVEEYGQLMSAGSVQVWDLSPEMLDIYPLDRRIEHGKRHGGRVLRRRIIIIDDWEEAT